MVLADRKVKVRELADATKISTERTRHILGEILHMKKLSCRWVPRMLTPDQKHERESTSKEYLDLLMRNRADFWRRLVTVDETWIHYYTPENRMSARQWTLNSFGWNVLNPSHSSDLAPSNYHLFTKSKEIWENNLAMKTK
ncbi:SETMR methyltransferase, partial [Acromyrmex insinuator]